MTHLKDTFELSERRACGLIGIAVSTYRYQGRKNDGELRRKLIELAREKPRYGYRRLHVLMEREGEAVNHKRVWRVYKEAGLSVKRRKRKRLVRVGRPLEPATQINEEWAIDFASDALATGRAIRVLSVVDACSRQCMALETDTSFASRRVTRVLERAMSQYGWPRGASAATTGRNSLRGTSWRGRWNGGSNCCTFSPGGPRRTGGWKAFTANCAMNA